MDPDLKKLPFSRGTKEIHYCSSGQELLGGIQGVPWGQREGLRASGKAS